MTATAHIREWARENGYTVGDRGSLAPEIVVDYELAHSGAVASVVPENRHLRIAKSLIRTSRLQGSPAVLQMAEDLMYDDVGMVIVALAREGWKASTA